jgi:uncharacterized protein involved in exopolysaccharide biosynthesis
VTSGPLDAYVSRLERELRKRGLDDARIVAEAREHLIDAMEDGLQRGLSPDAAEREAFERFGAPDTVAAHFVTERYRAMTTQFINSAAGLLGTVWHRKWWILTPTVLTALVTSVLSYYFLPTRYQSVAAIRVVPARGSAESVRPSVTGRTSNRVQQVSQSVLSSGRLERIIADFGLYQAEQQTAPLSDVVLRMRRDIDVNIATPPDPPDNDMGGLFNVSFVSSDPRTAMKVTERLASLFIEENLRDREVGAEGTSQFIDSQVEDVRRQIIGYEKTLETLRARSGVRLSQADLLPYEVLQETYKTLLTKRLESKIAFNLERRQIGEQFKVVDAPRLPRRPVGPSRFDVNVMGAFAGLGLGLIFVVRGGARKNPD